MSPENQAVDPSRRELAADEPDATPATALTSDATGLTSLQAADSRCRLRGQDRRNNRDEGRGGGSTRAEASERLSPGEPGRRKRTEGKLAHQTAAPEFLEGHPDQ